MIKNLFVKVKNQILFRQPSAPLGANQWTMYIPPTIDVDMFTDLVYQHTQTRIIGLPFPCLLALISSVLSDTLWSDPSMCLCWSLVLYVPIRAQDPPVGSLTLRWASLQDPAGFQSTSFIYGICGTNTGTNQWFKQCCQFVWRNWYFIDKEPHSIKKN